MFQEKPGSHAELQTTWQNKNMQHDAASKHLPIQKTNNKLKEIYLRATKPRRQNPCTLGRVKFLANPSVTAPRPPSPCPPAPLKYLSTIKKKKKEEKKSNKPSGYTDVRFYESNAKGDGSLLFFFFSGIRFYD